MSGIGRRGFIRSLLTAAATLPTIAAELELDPEKLLWVPGQKTIFLPPAPIIPPIRSGGNTLFTPDVLAKEVLAMLRNNLNLVQNINRAYLELKPDSGYGISIRSPRRYLA